MIEDYLGEIQKVWKEMDKNPVEEMIKAFLKAYEEGKRIFFFGNGGSAATASHFCEDLGKGTLSGPEDKKRIKAISLTDNTPYITAWANDEGYEVIFEQQLANLAEPGDIAVGISGSGNSANVLRAIDYANRTGLFTIGMTGYDGGKLGKMVRIHVHVPSFDMGLVEGVHLLLVHYVIDRVKKMMKGM
ncbi:MAG: phosphoheptose isomerase [Candidatus Latescibacterota bacterium]|nr:MAG: phosphoheptose isomerase [Candidatus Latescibacterota bacterium]